MLEFKQAVADRAGIRPRAGIVPVAGDLTKDWPGALAGAGFDRGRPAGWVIEGLLGYLTPAEGDQLMARVSQCSAPGSRLIAVYAAGDPLTVLASSGDSGDQSTDYLGRMVTAGPGAEPGPWLARHGWEATVITIGDQAQAMRRPVPPAFNPGRGGVECWLAEARTSSH